MESTDRGHYWGRIMGGQSGALFRTISLPLWAVGEIAQILKLFPEATGESHISSAEPHCVGQLLVTQKEEMNS
jgi:hypothetical protein